MDANVTRAELADALDEMRTAILTGLLATTTAATPGADTSNSMDRLAEALQKIEDRVTDLRDDRP